MPTILKEYKLNYFDALENSNKVWMGRAFDDGTYQAQYGRVREGTKLAQSNKQFKSISAALSELEKKRVEKLRKGYRDTATVDDGAVVTAAPINLKEVATAQIGGSEDPTTRALIEYLAQVNIHNICSATSITYSASNGTFRTPLGVLTPSAIAQARSLLAAIAAQGGDRDSLVGAYFQLVPHDFGMRIPPVHTLLATSRDIGQEWAILDALEAVLQSSSAEVGKVFECQLVKIPANTEAGRATFHHVKRLYESTLNVHHSTAGLKPKWVYEVEIPSMRSVFKRTSAQMQNVRTDLWHGTRASNLLSILKSGLMIPSSSAPQVTGRMFGDGLYFSLQSTKSLNYATNFWNGSGASGQRTFMFLCEVALGKIFKPMTNNQTFPKVGHDSTWVDAGTCRVFNHECVVYQPSQVNLKYLVEFE